MSEQQATFLKIISFLSGFLGAAICVCLGLRSFETDFIGSVLLFLLAAVFLIFIYPLYQIGKLGNTVNDQSKKIRVLAKKQNKAKKEEDSVNQYSPLNKPQQEATETQTTVAEIPGETEKTVLFPAVTEKAEKKDAVQIPELTKEFSSMAKQLNMHTGELIAIPADTTDSLEIYRPAKTENPLLPKTVTLAAGGLHTVAVRYNGTTIATGHTQYGQCDIAGWRDIISVCAGGHHTIGLKANGTAIATGYNGYGQCDVSDWTDICAIAAGTCHTVALMKDGSCVAKGDNTYGQCDVYDWSDIICIAANANYTLGLKSDGTILAVGANTKGDWSSLLGGLTSLAAGGYHAVALRADGTVAAIGNNTNKQCEVTRWNRIVSIAAGNFHTVGLQENGTVLAVGNNSYGQCSVETWTDVIAIAAGRHHTVGLTKNGNIIATGDNTYGQCAVADMSDIKTLGM